MVPDTKSIDFSATFPTLGLALPFCFDSYSCGSGHVDGETLSAAVRRTDLDDEDEERDDEDDDLDDEEDGEEDDEFDDDEEDDDYEDEEEDEDDDLDHDDPDHDEDDDEELNLI